MKTIRLITYSFIFTAFLAVSAFAQAQPTAKIALVRTDAFFAEKGGINKIDAGFKKLDAEFRTVNAELSNMNKRLQTLQNELQTLQKQANDPNNKVPINKAQVQAKVDEYQKLETDAKRKAEDAKKQYDKRRNEILFPINQDIAKAIGVFAKQKGYTMVLDSSRLLRSGILLYAQNTTDITKEFITFYNARPGGTATTRP